MRGLTSLHPKAWLQHLFADFECGYPHELVLVVGIAFKQDLRRLQHASRTQRAPWWQTSNLLVEGELPQIIFSVELPAHPREARYPGAAGRGGKVGEQRRAVRNGERSREVHLGVAGIHDLGVCLPPCFVVVGVAVLSVREIAVVPPGNVTERRSLENGRHNCGMCAD